MLEKEKSACEVIRYAIGNVQTTNEEGADFIKSWQKPYDNLD